MEEETGKAIYETLTAEEVSKLLVEGPMMSRSEPSRRYDPNFGVASETFPSSTPKKELLKIKLVQFDDDRATRVVCDLIGDHTMGDINACAVADLIEEPNRLCIVEMFGTAVLFSMKRMLPILFIEQETINRCSVKNINGETYITGEVYWSDIEHKFRFGSVSSSVSANSLTGEVFFSKGRPSGVICTLESLSKITSANKTRKSRELLTEHKGVGETFISKDETQPKDKAHVIAIILKDFGDNDLRRLSEYIMDDERLRKFFGCMTHDNPVVVEDDAEESVKAAKPVPSGFGSFGA